MTEKKEVINPEVFFSADIRIGSVVEANMLPNARVPAIAMSIDFGETGILQTSARITKRYTPEQMIGTQVVAVINLPPRQIGNVISECLVIGAVGEDGDVILLRPEWPAEKGQRIG